ncbi:MAG: DMT family transporter [Gemmatimonadota bacterium]
MLIVLALVAFLLGAGLTIQAGINASLRTTLGHPVHATVASFAVGLVAVLAFALVTGVGRPPAEAFARTPWWLYVGGIIGAIYVGGSVVLAPKLGAAVLVSLLIAGQLTAALIVDPYGALGFPQAPATPARLAGVALLIVGVILVRRG